jgi:hypothetical protein
MASRFVSYETATVPFEGGDLRREFSEDHLDDDLRTLHTREDPREGHAGGGDQKES